MTDNTATSWSGKHDPFWQADLARAGGRRALFREQSLWAIWVYRFGQRADRRRDGFTKRFMLRAYWLAFRLSETITGISIPKECRIGKGFRIWHFGGIMLNPLTVIGDNCTMRHGVTIGNRSREDDVPVIGNDVEFGAYAQVLGKITIGDRCKIGALTVVLKDMPDDAIAVGQAARIIERGPVDGAAS